MAHKQNAEAGFAAAQCSATYLRVQCFECAHKDEIRSDYYRPKGGEFWCDECGGEREYEPDLSPNDKLTDAGPMTHV